MSSHQLTQAVENLRNQPIGYVTTTDPLTGQAIVTNPHAIQDNSTQIDYLKNLIYNLDRQLQDSEKWKLDAQRLEDVKIQ